MSTYGTKHVNEACDCDFLEVPQKDVQDLVQEGCIPILHFRDGHIVVGSAEQYVAISHVWKDGLGNVGHNSLPRCQIEVIAQKVSALGCEWSWIDTICVPAEKELKAAALQSMENVY